MRKIFMLIFLAAVLFLKAAAQEISIEKGWKFTTGDSSQWASPNYNDHNWKPIDITRNWEAQGYPNYDGFGWYRLHVVIPSSIKEKSYLKDSIRLDLGIIDDNDEVYLNGKLIAEYGGKGGDIKTPQYGPRSYTIAADNPAVLWDKENVLAVRIFDTGGDGGIYGDEHKISMADLMGNISINTDADFSYDDNDNLVKSVKLMTNGNYLFKGKLLFKVIDPENNGIVYEKTNDADFSAGKPFTYKFNLAKLAKKSFRLEYTFTDEKSGKTKSKTEGTPYVLTPYPSAKPRINGADVFGAHPGQPIFVPDTGNRQKAIDLLCNRLAGWFKTG